MIGIFDSELGGLAVLREIQRQLPDHDLLYFGDTAGGPYGSKSPEFVTSRLADGLLRLSDAGAGLLVVADHSAAACLTMAVRQRLPVPVLDIVTHGVVPAVASLAPKSLGIIGPPVVEAAGTHKAAIQKAVPETKIFSAVTPLLSPLVDAEWLKKPETVMIVKKYLHFFKLRQVDVLVPASNHYLSMAPIIQRKIGKRVAVVNAVPMLARMVKAFLSEHPDADVRCKGGGACRATVSDLSAGMEKAARGFFGKNIRLEQA